MDSRRQSAWWDLTAICVGLLCCGACSFDVRSDQYECDPGGGCPDDRVCADGWCVVAGSSIDANTTDAAFIDAMLWDALIGVDAPVAVDAGIDASETDATVLCPNGDCGPLENPTSCPADCSTCAACSAGTCAESCGGVGGDCELSCAASTCTCNFDCIAANNCNLTCGGGTSCEINCTEANNCDNVRCLGGAECRLHCTDANNCSFQLCTGGSGEVSCSDGWACNRDC